MSLMNKLNGDEWWKPIISHTSIEYVDDDGDLVKDEFVSRIDFKHIKVPRGFIEDDMNWIVKTYNSGVNEVPHNCNYKRNINIDNYTLIGAWPIELGFDETHGQYTMLCVDVIKELQNS